MQHAVCHLVPRDTSAFKFDKVEIAFILKSVLFLLAETINWYWHCNATYNVHMHDTDIVMLLLPHIQTNMLKLQSHFALAIFDLLHKNLNKPK